MCCQRAALCAPAARSSPTSSKPMATRNTRTRRRDAMMAEIKPTRTAGETGPAEALAARRPRLAGTAVAPRREAAFRRFEAVGLPHRRIEDWKYTDLRALMRDAKPLAAPPDAQAKARAKRAGALLDEGEALRLVFADGAFVPELSATAAL